MTLDGAPPPACQGTAASYAEVSPCGRYRWRLGRRWGPGPLVLFVLLNPSTADAFEPDPTSTRCEGYARRWGFDGFEIVNLFSWRATEPKDLNAVHGSSNLYGLRHTAGHRAALRECDLVVVGWGSLTARRWAWPAARKTLAQLLESHGQVFALKTNQDGTPGHPLYLRADLDLQPYGATT